MEYFYSVDESGFGQSTTGKPRATDIAALTPLPTHNLQTEHNLSVFDHRAEKSAKCRNCKLKAKCIRNDMMLYKGNQGVVERSS